MFFKKKKKKKAIHSNYFQIQVSRCYASTELRVLQGAVVSPQWKWLWKNNLRKMGCEITVEFNSCLCHCRSAPSYTLFRLLRPSSSFSFHSTWQKESGIVGMQDCCHSAPIKPLQMEEDRKTFCFCCFFSIFFFFLFFWHHIESLALELHIRLDHTIAFFARGSCLVSIYSWPLSDFTIRGCGGWGTISE